MPTKTRIAWCDYVSNPIRALYTVHGNGRRMGHACIKISEGCKYCWASVMNMRFGTMLEYIQPNMEIVQTVLDERELERLAHKFNPRPPYKDGRQRPLLFLGDMTDLGGAWIPDNLFDQVWDVITVRNDVDFMILTKRPERFLPRLLWRKVLPNVIMGVSVENQARADARVAPMWALKNGGWKTALSYEPALGMVDWRGWEFLDWMICGGESGPQARPMRLAWARAARDFCQAHNIPFFFKQWGAWAPLCHLPWVTDATTFKHQPVDGMVKIGNGRAAAVLDGRAWREVLNG